MGTPAVPRCERRVAACAGAVVQRGAPDPSRGGGLTAQLHGDVEVRHREAGDADVAAAVAPVGERLAVDPAAAVLVVGAEEAQHALEDEPGAHACQQPRRALHDVGVHRHAVAGQRAHDVGVGHVLAGHEEGLRRAEAVHRGCRCRRPRGGGGHGVVVARRRSARPRGRLRRGGRRAPVRPGRPRRPGEPGTRDSPTPRCGERGG